MPESLQNRSAEEPAGGDERFWKRRLEHGRLSSVVEDNTRKDISPVTEDHTDPKEWRRKLEHGRLSVLAMPQTLAFAGPGAAPVAAMAADEAKQAGKAMAAGAGSLERDILKAKGMFVMRQQTMGLLRNWYACWIFIPIVFGIMITTNNRLRTIASRYKDASRTSLKPPKTPDEATKFQLQHITWVLLSDWMQWTFWTCLWYGLLFLLVILIVLIYQLVKCGITVGIFC